MTIEELAFKNYIELKDIQKIDLLLIIEFLQNDRKQWINEYTKAHNDYVELQQENQQLKDNWNELKEWLEEYKENSYGLGSYETGISDGLGDVLKKMQELEGNK